MVRKTTKHYIAYLDILGYKDFLKNKPEQAEQYLQTILDAVEKIKHFASNFQYFKDEFQIDADLKLKVFSDNILLCLSVNQGDDEIRRAIVFLLSVASIQRGLVLGHGLLVRGGITISELYIDEDLVFGQGLVEAVELESKAEYPCIVASDALQKFLSALLHDVTEQYQKLKEIVQKEKRNEHLSNEENAFLSEKKELVAREVYRTNTLRELLKHFDNETAFLNYLFDLSFAHLFGYEFADYVNREAAKDPKRYKDIVGTVEDYYAILWAHREMVIKEVKEYCNYNDVEKTDPAAVLQREKIIRKYMWLLRYHVSMCQERKFQQGLFPFRFGCDETVLRQIVEVGKL